MLDEASQDTQYIDDIHKAKEVVDHTVAIVELRVGEIQIDASDQFHEKTPN